LKILLVEDEPKLAQIVQQGLKEHGFLVEWADDGVLGLHMALDGSFDAVVLDVNLPGKDGFQVLREIRKSGSTVAVLMLTSRNTVDDRVRGLDHGADDYLAKPFDFKELLARLRAVLRRPKAELRATLRVTGLTLNLKTREVRRDGQPIKLTPREFGILEYLLCRKGQVLTKSMIMDHVWPSDADCISNSNLVEVYVNQLRKKIDQDHGVKLIQTVRGSGYMIQDPA